MMDELSYLRGEVARLAQEVADLRKQVEAKPNFDPNELVRGGIGTRSYTDGRNETVYGWIPRWRLGNAAMADLHGDGLSADRMGQGDSGGVGMTDLRSQTAMPPIPDASDWGQTTSQMSWQEIAGARLVWREGGDDPQDRCGAGWVWQFPPFNDPA